MEKISIPTVSFATAIDAVKRSVPKTTPIQDLYNFKMKLSQTELELTATDMVTTSIASIPIDIPFDIDGFTVLVDADRISKFVLSLDTPSISVLPDLENNKVVLKSGGRKTTLNTASANNYPIIRIPEPENRIDVNPELFSLAVKSIASYCLPSNDPQLSIMRGVELAISATDIKVSAFNGYSGAVWKTGDSAANKVLVMGDQIADFCKIFANYDELHIGVPRESDSRAFFFGYIQDIKINTQIQILSDGDKYPDVDGNFQRVLSQEKLMSFVFDKAEILNALKPLDAYDNVAVVVYVKDGKLNMVSEDEHISEYEASIDCTGVEGDEIVFKVNRKYFKQAISNVSTPEITTSNKLSLIVFMSKDNDEYTYYQGIGKISF